MRFDRLGLRYGLEYAAFKAIARILSALPVETASALSGWLWRIVAPSLSRHRRALANLKLAFPDRTEAEHEAIARGMWENLGRTFGESFHLLEIASGDRIVWENHQRHAGLKQLKTGKVFCSAHLANWEIVVVGLIRAGLSPIGVYQRIKNPRVDNYVAAMRSVLYPGGLLPKDRTMPRRVLRAIREGGSVALLADQRDYTGLNVPFFGQPTPSTQFPALIARTTGSQLYVGWVVRHPGVRFKIYLEEILVPNTDDRDQDIEVVTAALQAHFERLIRERPEQWMWSHRRWG